MTTNLTIKCPYEHFSNEVCSKCNGTGHINPEVSASQILSLFLKDGYIDKTKMENSLFYPSSTVQEIIEKEVNDYKQKVRDAKEKIWKQLCEEEIVEFSRDLIGIFNLKFEKEVKL